MGRKPATRSAALEGKNNDGDSSESNAQGTGTGDAQQVTEPVETTADVAVVSTVFEGQVQEIEHSSGGDEEEGRTVDEDGEKTITDYTSEDAFRKSQKVNSVASIVALRLKPHSISRLMIPLCRLAIMPMVHPALQCDISRLEEDFVNGYRDGSSVFYVSLTNEQGEMEQVSDVEKSA